MPAQPKTLYMKVSSRIVAELPRFFGSFETAIGEMFQNAYRAEANSVIVSYSESQHILIVSDNGPGCEPDRLLTAGETGWDNPKVAQDPAGIGAFSLLRPEYVESVNYESHGKHNWTMTLNQDSLNGAPVVVTPLQDNPAKKGMTITLQLNEKLKVTKDMLRRAKGFYPFDLVWIDNDSGDVDKLETLKSWEPVLTFDLPGVGKLEALYIDRSSHYSQTSEKTAVWQCIPIHSSAFANALANAAQQMAAPGLASEMIPLKVRFFVDTESGLRAKLPDRNEILADEHLEAAALAIVKEVYERCTKAITDSAKSWSDQTEANHSKGKITFPKGMEWLDEYLAYNNSAFARVMEFAGYVMIDYPLPETANGFNANEGDGDYLDLDCDQHKYFLRSANIVRTDSDLLATSLNNQNIPAILADGVTTNIAITNLRADGHNRWLAMADSIVVDGVGPVKYLINLEGSGWDIPDIDDHPDINDDVAIVFAGTPQGFLSVVDEEFWTGVIGIRLSHEGDLCDYESYEYGEYSLDARSIRTDLEAEAMRFLSGNLSEMRKEMFEIIRAVEEMEKGANDITYQLSALAKITTSANVLASIKSRIEQAVREVKSACEEARLEARDLDQKINTAISGQPTAVLIPTP